MVTNVLYFIISHASCFYSVKQNEAYFFRIRNIFAFIVVPAEVILIRALFSFFFYTAFIAGVFEIRIISACTAIKVTVTLIIGIFMMVTALFTYSIAADRLAGWAGIVTVPAVVYID